MARSLTFRRRSSSLATRRAAAAPATALLFESGTDWDQRLAEHTAEVDGLKDDMERAHAATTASEAARQAAAAEAEALRISYEARLEKLNQQVAQPMHSPPRGTPMLHSGALYGAQAGAVDAAHCEGVAQRSACCACQPGACSP
jgi:septal ring factor EnvC (AmiA/AmiB activator)